MSAISPAEYRTPVCSMDVHQISKAREDEESEKFGYRSSNFKWFGESVPESAKGECFMCGHIDTLSISSMIKDQIPISCPQCKRKSFKIHDFKKWEKYVGLKLWEFDLFSDQFKMQYIAYNNGNNSRHIIGLKGDQSRGLLASRVKNKSELENSLMHLSGLCYSAANTHELHTRIARHENHIWIDMCDDKWRAIKITPNEDWKVEEKPPILFRRYDHMKPFTAEQGTKADLDAFLKLINFGGENVARQKLLYAGYLATQFLPDIQTALLMPVGPSGSAKSTMSVLTRSVIDPTTVREITLTKNTDLPMTFMQHRLPVFGNCGYLTQEQSDMFCNLITGGSIYKRKLFTDSDSVQWTFMHSTILNGIAPPSLAPDLMTRTLKFELDTIPTAFMRAESDLMKDVDALMPRVRGYLMQLVAEALAGPLPPADRMTRLGDFGRIGDFLTTKMGWERGEFLNAIIDTGIESSQEAVEADYVGGILLAVLEKNGDNWDGTASELMNIMIVNGLDPKNPNSPKTTARLSDAVVGRLKTGLGLFKYVVGRGKSNGKRTIVIRKLEKEQELRSST